MLSDAIQAFDQLRDANVELDVHAWTAMIGKAALELFEEMTKSFSTRKGSHQKPMVRPNCQTFAAVLNACSHSGLVEDTLRIFDSMEAEFAVVPDLALYNSVVDALVRAGRLDEAERFIATRMTERNGVTYKTLLGACRWCGDVERAERAAKAALEFDPENASVYALLETSYAAAGRLDDKLRVRAMKQSRSQEIKKIPGRTTIEVASQVHAFVTSDEAAHRLVL